MLETSVRLLKLLSLLQARREWSGAELAERLEVTTRTVRNDMERLRILGYQVHSTTGTAGGYRLGAGAQLPPLLLDDEEAVAVAVALSTSASGTVEGLEETSVRALAKLESMLPSRLRRRLSSLQAATVSVARRGPGVDAAALTGIAAAVRDHETLRFDYLNQDGAPTVRAAEPHRLVYTGRRWYLAAWDTDRKDWRTFRVDRMRLRTPNGPRFTPREPPEGDAAAYVMRGVSSRARSHQARIRLHVSLAVASERLPPEAGMLEAIDETSCLFITGADDIHDLASFLGSLGFGFSVIEPAALADHLRVLADRFRVAATPSETLDA
ncbi:helix-turn-helix transcriptional regulator [Actinomadura rudentiformis]|uniref:WYL domain-containing protein n=1 Tax=Actinomadura rudentiformis TaxID=359158 RepID=A0A6H9Z4P5_9ACTN|nr:WYL domain-containing protein [Actinomadura rudentiformis]KAB2350921.1 WYL domain-containing protein [Actinomadura rudentiformis]